MWAIEHGIAQTLDLVAEALPPAARRTRRTTG